MKNLELIEKTLKKNSTQQLFSKLGKLNQSSQEYEVILTILKARGQDVSNWENSKSEESEVVYEDTEGMAEEDLKVVEQVEEKEPSLRDKLIEEVDQFMDELIAQKRTGVNLQVLKSLGGQYGSDLDVLLENASIEQLNDALSFKNKKEEKIVEIERKKKNTNNKKSFIKSKEIEKFESGIIVSFVDKDKKYIKGKIVKFFLSHKNNSEICELLLDDNKLVHKRTNKLKTIDE